MTLWRDETQLNAIPASARLTLGEGESPVIRSKSIGPKAGLSNLYFKLEMISPTGSYKDRFGCMAVSHMVAQGKTRCLATSSGNTGAALSAYSAAAGISCEIVIVEAAPLEKLKQMLAYGAKLHRVRGFGTDAATGLKVFEALHAASATEQASLQISAYKFSPVGMLGVETVAYEIAEQIPEAKHVFCPAGGGGLAVALARGYATRMRVGRIAKSAAIEVVQPAGNDTIATPLRERASRGREVVCTTRISGLQVPNVIDADAAINECLATGGSGHLVTDEQVWEAQARLAREEGVFSEPAGSVSLAGALRAVKEGRLDPDAPIVCILTGFGFKDQPAIDRMVSTADCPVIDVGEFEKRLRG